MKMKFRADAKDVIIFLIFALIGFFTKIDLTKIGVVSDEHTHFFEIDINNKDLLVNLLNTNIELLDHYKNDIIELLNNVTDKIIKALESDHAARLMFGGVRRAVQKIHCL